MAAPVIAHEAKVLRERRNLEIPHLQRGAERIRQHEYGRALRALDFDVDRTAVGVDDGHSRSLGNLARDTFLAAGKRRANPARRATHDECTLPVTR